MRIMKNPEQHLIYKVRCGSHAYGTNLPTSDEDFAGIFIQPLEYFFGLQAFDMVNDQSEEDKSYYSLRKYANLAVANNPNVLELLFVDESDVLLHTIPAGMLREHRTKFLSQRCRNTFVGYAKAQLHRIRTHTKWLEQELNDMKLLWPYIGNEQVTRDWVAWRFGQNMLSRVDQEFSKQLHSDYSSDLLRAAYNHFYRGTSIGNEDVILEAFKGSGIVCPDRKDKKFYKEGQPRMFNGNIEHTWIFQEHLYKEAKKKRDQYVTWMAERNPQRHETELQFGYDTKHAMHLVRLLRMGYEILSEGRLTVKRTDAKELLDIRAGKWTYGEITNYADGMVERIDAIPSDKCAVPEIPDVKFINQLIIDITKECLLNAKP